MLDYEIIVRSFSNLYFADVVEKSSDMGEYDEFQDLETEIEIPEKVSVCVVLTEVQTKMYRDDQTMAKLKVYDLTEKQNSQCSIELIILMAIC